VDSSYLVWVTQRVGRSRLLGKLGDKDPDALANVAKHLCRQCRMSTREFKALQPHIVLVLEIVIFLTNMQKCHSKTY
jgi:hypothetical protein